MRSKSYVWLGFSSGVSVGAGIPALWEAAFFSLSTIALAALGGLLGILVGRRLSHDI